MEIIDLDQVDVASFRPPQGHDPILVGVSRTVLPAAALPLLEQLTFTLAPGGPGRTWIDAPRPEDDPAPEVARVLVDVLSLTRRLPVEEGLVVESLAYSALLAGPAFRTWRHRAARRTATEDRDGDPVRVARRDDVLQIRLCRPSRHNAFSRGMRELLLEALELASVDETITRVELSGAGRSFCSGGDLDEFGTTPDVVTAHGIRIDRSCGLALHRLRDRVHPHLHGACLGAGIELPAFANRVTATRDAYFGLPEMSLGMIPGAGGTVSVTRRIGPWRTAYLALTGRRIDAATAVAWGLVDELV